MLQKRSHIFQTTTFHNLEGWARRTLGRCYEKRGQINEAKKEFRRSLKIFDERGSTKGQNVLYRDLVKLNLRARDLAEAEAMAERALKHTTEGLTVSELLTRIAFRYDDWESNNPIFDSSFGIAASVAGPPEFNVETALQYALEQKFQWLQVYASKVLINDANLQAQIKDTCKEANINLMIHAPDLLASESIKQESLLKAIDAILSEQPEKFVVFHYDQRQSVQETVEYVQSWTDRGFTLCLENFHVLKGKHAGEEAYKKYLQVIEMSLHRNRKIVAVLDIPRLYYNALDLEEKAFEIWEHVFTELSRLKCRTFLHLIDILHADSARDKWRALGEGIIPYDRLLPLLYQKSYPWAVIFEFEDMEKPLKSREFIRSTLSKVYTDSKVTSEI